MDLMEANFNLIRAAYSGEESDVKTALLSKKVDKNCRENTGYHYTAVQRAALSNESVVKLFIEDNKVKLNLKDDLGRTLLHLSWRTSVQRLKKTTRMQPKDWDLLDKIEQTPFLTHARFVNNIIGPELLEVRLSSGEWAVDMTKTTIDGFTALHQVVEQDPLSFPKWYNFRPPGDRCKFVSLLLDKLKERSKGAEGDVLLFVNKKDKLKRSALHYIAENGCVEILNTLWNWFSVESRSQIHLQELDFHGFAPLHLAVRRGHSHMVRRILEFEINCNLDATVAGADPSELKVYEEYHKELCRPNLFSRKPSAEYSGKLLRPLHFAAMSGYTEITQLLLSNNNTDVFTATPPTPLDYSIVNRHFQVAAMLLLDPLGRTVLHINRNGRREVFDTVLCLAEGPDEKIRANQLLTLLQQVIPPILSVQPNDGIRIELLITVAARENWHEIIRHILKWTPEVNVNFKSQWPTYGTLDATPLHFAVFQGHRDAVRELLTHHPLDANSEDLHFRTPLEIATKIANSNTRREIEKLLMGRSEVKELVDRLYRDRQVFVDAANALLVGAALIASVTFAGWLQPPLGITPYYEYPESLPAPPGTYESYAAVRQHAAVQAFWFFNSLSFFLSIATILTGASASMPSLENAFIGTVLKSVKESLIYTSILLAISVTCVLGAFASAGFAVLPPAVKYNWSIISTFAIGALVCIICLAYFLGKLSRRLK
jgi:ankyrin repeat protein